MKQLISLALLSLLPIHPSALTGETEKGNFPLLKGGKGAAVVINPTLHKTHRLAWKYVRDYNIEPNPVAARPYADRLVASVKESTGHALRIVQEKDYTPEKDGPALYLGATEKAKSAFGDRLKEIDSDGYVIHVTPEALILAGNMEYALYDFLSTYLGIDTYLPVDLFTITPKHSEVLIPAGSRVEIPAFFSRCINVIRSVPGQRLWRLHPGNGRYDFHHYIGNRFMLPPQFPDNPEFFPSKDGKPLKKNGHFHNPCVTNPKLVDIVLKNAQEQFEKSPHRLSVSLAMNDSYRYCQCETCKPLQGKGRSISVNGKTSWASDYWYTFINRVAGKLKASHPDKFVGTLAYCYAEYPPTFPIERNVLPFITDSCAHWGDEEEKRRDLVNYNAWMDRVDRIGFYAESGNSNFGFQGPMMWIAERLLWNPKADVDALLTRWTDGCFGPAGPSMKRYYRLLESALDRGSRRAKPHGYLWSWNYTHMYGQLHPDDFADLWKAVDEARELAGGDETLLKRIDYMASSLKISEVLVQRYHAHAEAEKLLKAKAAPDQVLTAMLKGEAEWSRFELWRYMLKMKEKKDYNQKIGIGLFPTRAERLMEYVLDRTAWKAAEGAIAKGEKNVNAIRQAATDALPKLATNVTNASPAAAKRMDDITSLAQRVAGAGRTDAAPVIDGKAGEACWQWNGKQPWFLRNSAMPFPYGTDFAFAYDETNLYIAARCSDQSLTDYNDYLKQYGDKAGTYGFKVYERTPSITFYLDGGSKAGAGMKPYIVSANPYGGLWESRKVVSTWKTVWNETTNEWVSEISVPWSKLGVAPEKKTDFRLNVVRTIRNRWNVNCGAWYLWHQDYAALSRGKAPRQNERGWLILEPKK
ncbi:MAG: DUF4838 domain-containing protein [Planctomycetota bacterium]|jgi:hypothetical protein